jgi:hypothetical protein
MDQQEPKVNSVKAIYTRTKANEGVRVDLKDFPGSNWIRVLGVDSDPVQAAILAFNRAKAASKEAGEKKEGGPFEDPAVIASMVTEWSFDEPLTPEVLRETLVECPHLGVIIVNEALDRDRFFNKPPASSSGTPKDISA